MGVINLFEVKDKSLDDAIENAISVSLTETVMEIAKDKELHDTHDEPWKIGQHCRNKLENILKAELDEESSNWFESFVYRELRNSSIYTPRKAHKLIVNEFYNGMRDTVDSERWRQIVDLLKDYGYLNNVSVLDILSERDFGCYNGSYVKNNGLTIGWNTGLTNAYARLGIDSQWNKVHDATILLYWPNVDSIGKRRWCKIIDKIKCILDKNSKDHKKFVKHWDKYHDDYKIDMNPMYGSDA